MATFKHLVRCTQGGATFYGDLLQTSNNEYTVKKLLGDPFEGFRETTDVIHTDKVNTNQPELSCSSDPGQANTEIQFSFSAPLNELRWCCALVSTTRRMLRKQM